MPGDPLSKIYPSAHEMVDEARRDGCLRLLVEQSDPANPGVIALVERADFVVGYISFAEDLPEPLAPLVRKAIAPFTAPDENREVCCNIYGRNPGAIRLAQQLGFSLEMHGVKLAYCGPPLREAVHPGWEFSGYLPGSAPLFARLFDRAYAPLIAGIEKEPNPHARNLDGFMCELETLALVGDVLSVWIGDGPVEIAHRELAGACLMRGGYIRDLAVDPHYQNRGLGSALLAHAVNDRIARGYQQVSLDVLVENTGAQRFYARQGFFEAGCFADHTFRVGS